MATGTPRHSWTDNITAITAAKLNTLEQDVADGLTTALAAESELADLDSRVDTLETSPGGVSSVNGETGAVVLDPADVGAQPTDADLTTIAGLAPADGELLVRETGTWGSAPLTELVDTTPITAADFGLVAPKGARAYANATGQTVAAGAYPVYLDLNATDFNEDATLYTVDLTNDRITVLAGGLFLVSWDVNFGESTNLREAYITKNGGNAILAAAAGAGGVAGRTSPIRLAANDYLQVIAYVETTGSTLITSASHRCGLGLYRIGL